MIKKKVKNNSLKYVLQLILDISQKWGGRDEKKKNIFSRWKYVSSVVRAI